MHDTAALVSPHDQRVTFVELFFDLVFVFCVTKITALFHGHFDPATAGGALLCFWLVWWSWTQFTWALNAADTEHPHVQGVMLVATALAFLMGVGIPGALHGGAAWFALPYVLLRLLGLVLYHLAASTDARQRRAVRTFAYAAAPGLVVVLAGAWIGGAAVYWAWTVAVVLDIASAAVGGQLDGWNLHAEHFVERHGLIVIIALGEALIVAASGLVDAPRTATVIVTGLLAVAVTCGLWWSYFERARGTMERALEAKREAAQSQGARDAFSVLHFPMLCGVIAMAAATEQALAHPDEPLDVTLRLALGAGALLFVSGTAAAVWRLSGHTTAIRWLLPLLAAVAVVLVGQQPWAALGILAITLLVLAVAERRRT